MKRKGVSYFMLGLCTAAYLISCASGDEGDGDDISFSDKAWGTAQLIEMDDSGDAYSPQVEVDGSENAIAVWAQDDGTRESIWSNTRR